jgi:hypothetical protein
MKTTPGLANATDRSSAVGVVVDPAALPGAPRTATAANAAARTGRLQCFRVWRMAHYDTAAPERQPLRRGEKWGTRS